MEAALITGAGRRIGACLARHLARRGPVVLHYNRSADDAAAVAAAIRDDGAVCHLLQADLATRDGVEGLMARALALAPGLDTLINNAALFRYDRLATLDWASWQAHLAVNLTAPAWLTRDFAAARAPDGPGVVINLLDCKLSGPADPAFLSYTVAKAGLAELTRQTAKALAPHIRVVGLAPGYSLQGGLQDAARFAEAAARTPLGRPVDPAELARAVDLILDCRALTGSVLTVDGGAHLGDRS